MLAQKVLTYSKYPVMLIVTSKIYYYLLPVIGIIWIPSAPLLKNGFIKSMKLSLLTQSTLDKMCSTAPFLLTFLNLPHLMKMCWHRYIFGTRILKTWCIFRVANGTLFFVFFHNRLRSASVRGTCLRKQIELSSKSSVNDRD